jgi:hypothetical protein
MLVVPLIDVTERGPSDFDATTLDSLPAFAGTKGRGNDDNRLIRPGEIGSALLVISR